ncbi:MAG: Hsp20/alpha crystallin family protein [Candidatus Dadabacteria bacterium]|nr:MAG: Hsp20/alpha crystallin family protein [Candidatus Dadabacteria bacterium]
MRLRDLVPWRSKKVPVKRNLAEATPLMSFKNEMDRLFNSFFGDWLPTAFTDVMPSTFSREWGAFSPSIDVQETDREIIVKAEVPGLEEKDLDLELTDEALIIRGEKREEIEKSPDKHTYYRETSYGSFERYVPLDVEIDSDRVEASLKKGVLTVTLPKREPSSSSRRKVSIKAE